MIKKFDSTKIFTNGKRNARELNKSDMKTVNKILTGVKKDYYVKEINSIRSAQKVTLGKLLVE